LPARSDIAREKIPDLLAWTAHELVEAALASTG
jgi:hypothetical protein